MEYAKHHLVTRIWTFYHLLSVNGRFYLLSVKYTQSSQHQSKSVLTFDKKLLVIIKKIKNKNKNSPALLNLRLLQAYTFESPSSAVLSYVLLGTGTRRKDSTPHRTPSRSQGEGFALSGAKLVIMCMYSNYIFSIGEAATK